MGRGSMPQLMNIHQNNPGHYPDGRGRRLGVRISGALSLRKCFNSTAIEWRLAMFKGLDHIAIVVADTEVALQTWRDRFGLPVLFSETINGGTVRLTHLDLGNTHLQLVQPLTADHPLAAWLATHHD